jgi:hypothetical protein
MRSGYMRAAVAICAALFASAARSETLADLVKKEEGVEFGVCNLTPRPNVGGKEVYVVVPARFPSPGIWLTRTLLFVGVDEGKNVSGVAEAKTLDDVGPREVISVTCNKNTVTVKMSNRMSPATLSYMWNGKDLSRKSRKK